MDCLNRDLRHGCCVFYAAILLMVRECGIWSFQRREEAAR